MAIDLTKNPWIFDATTQVDTVTQPVFVKSILLTSAGTGGDVTVLTASGGTEVIGTITLSTYDREQVAVNEYVEGIYIQALPTSAKVYVYHGC